MSAVLPDEPPPFQKFMAASRQLDLFSKRALEDVDVWFLLTAKTAAPPRSTPTR